MRCGDIQVERPGRKLVSVAHGEAWDGGTMREAPTVS